MNKLVLILPYFGKHKNYFQLFLNSVSFNENEFDLLLFTDNFDNFIKPKNVILNIMSFEDFKTKIQQKFEFKICLNQPYKLCDYKPTYGYVFYDEIKNYKYWGYCDCDLLFGDFKIIDKLLDDNYDKLFALGHLTIYKNTIENNSIFMSKHNGIYPYIEAFTTNEIYVFDEDGPQINNVHAIFLCNQKKVFFDDLSLNITETHVQLYRTVYDGKKRKFSNEYPNRKEFFYYDGKVISLCKMDKNIVKYEYLYVHLQRRKMKMYNKGMNIQICPESFKNICFLPKSKREFNRKYPKLIMANTKYFFKKLYGKLNKILNVKK